MPIRREDGSHFDRPEGFAELVLGNQLGLVVFEDELWEETRGQLGRVNVSLSIQSVKTAIDHMDNKQLEGFIKGISQEKGIHSGRLELTLEHGIRSSHEYAINILAHHFNVGAEVLTALGERDVFTMLGHLPGKQGEGFKQRMIREGRLQHVISGDIPEGSTVHLMSDGTLFQVTG